MDEMTSPPWPDPAQPGAPSTPWDGVPVEPEKDGWHWLDLLGEWRTPWKWLAASQTWAAGGGEYPPRVMARYSYHGPCLTVADLATTARVHAAAGFKAGVEAAKAQCIALRDDPSCSENGQLWANTCALAVSALPIPDAPALATALEKARREEREAVKHAVRSGHLHEKSEDLSRLIAAIDHDAKRRAVLPAIRARTPTTGETTDAG